METGSKLELKYVMTPQITIRAVLMDVLESNLAGPVLMLQVGTPPAY